MCISLRISYGKNYSLSNSYKANYNSVSLASNPEMIFYKPYAQSSLRHSTIDYTINTSGTHGISKDAFDSFLFLDGKPLATTSKNKDDAAVLDADKNYSIREVLPYATSACPKFLTRYFLSESTPTAVPV